MQFTLSLKSFVLTSSANGPAGSEETTSPLEALTSSLKVSRIALLRIFVSLVGRGYSVVKMF